MVYNRLGWAEWHYTVIAEALNGTARQQKRQLSEVVVSDSAIVGSLSHGHSCGVRTVMSFWRCGAKRYNSNHRRKSTYIRRLFIVEKEINVEQVRVGCEAVARLQVWTSRRVDWQLAVLSRSDLGILSFLANSDHVVISQECLYANNLGDASQMERDGVD